MQAIYYLAPESQLRTFVRESYRIVDSDLRVFNKVSELTMTGRIKLPPAGKKDILIVGDSMSFGAFLKSEDVFSSVIEATTNKTIANLSIPGAGPVVYNRMAEIGMRYDPDLIIYCVFANDFADSWLNPFKRSAPLSLANQYCAPETDPALFVNREKLTYKLGYLRKRILNFSKTVQLVKKIGVTIVYYDVIEKAFSARSKDDLTTRVVEFDNGYYYYHPEFWRYILNLNNEDIQSGFNETVFRIKRAHIFAKGLHKKFAVVLIPSKEMIRETLASNSTPPILQAYKILNEDLGRAGIPVFDITGLLVNERRINKQRVYMPTDCHLNKAGHRLMAEGLVQYLKQEQLW